jgi:hypothetical protein
MKNLNYLYSSLSFPQLLIAGLFAAAAFLFVCFLLWKAHTFLIGPFKKGKKPATYIRERNRFKAEIAKEKDSDNFKDALYSIALVLAIFIVLVFKVHGK